MKGSKGRNNVITAQSLTFIPELKSTLQFDLAVEVSGNGPVVHLGFASGWWPQGALLEFF